MSTQDAAVLCARSRVISRLIRCVSLSLLPLLLLPGCSPDGSGDAATPEDTAANLSAAPAQVRIVATLDFGASTMFDVAIPFDDGTTAMDALREVAEVDTAYGGGFVRGINGTGSEQGGDWFYYVNGFLARTGAGDYRLHDGDTVHWDFHDPAAYRGVSATLGSFPLAYVNGYSGQRRETVVAYENEFAELANAVASQLESAGAPGVSLVELSLLADEQKQSRHLVIISRPETDPVREIYDNRARLGLFASIQDSGLRTYLASGDEHELYQHSAGVLQTIQNPWNPSGVGACQNVVLLVSGTDAEGVTAAAVVLLEQADRMMTWCGAVVLDGGVERVPVPVG